MTIEIFNVSSLFAKPPLQSNKVSESSSSTGPNLADETQWVIDRRRDQVTKEPGYIASPQAVNIPGIGFAYGVVGSIFNIRETEMDAFFFTSNGDTNGFGLGLIDTPIYKETITFNLFHSRFRDSGIESHRRGIDSDPALRRTLKFSRTRVTVSQFSARFWEKRLQFYLGVFQNSGSLDKILDKDGNVVADPENQSSTFYNRFIGTLLDFTDDRADPRKGVQFESQLYQPPKGNNFDPTYYIVDYNVLGYVPIGKISTWVFNAYKSDAIVTKQGETNPDAVRVKQGIGCANLPVSSQDVCLEEEDKIVQETTANNKYGTASSIGGTQRMRSYVTGRFKAAHAATFGTELRLNLTEEFTPFNVYIAKGIRTGVQLAIFGEWGSVNDFESKLYRKFKSSYGAGIRLIIASGFVFRIDVARGSEGIQPTVFFNYPWFVF